MSAGSSVASSRRGGRWRRGALWVALLAALGAVVALGGRPQAAGEPFDPGSTQPDGLAALVEVIESLGGHADIALHPSGEAQTAFLAHDAVTDASRRATRRWVRGGGRLVVAAPSSLLPELEPARQPLTSGLTATDVAVGRCRLEALREVDSVRLVGQQALTAPPEGTGCVPVGDGWWLVARSEGDGHVIGLGGAAPLTNRHLAGADNAVLAAALLVPRDGTTVTILRPPEPGEGDRTLGELVPSRVRTALWTLALAFVLYALAEGRRHGRPVSEGLSVAVPGSELVTGVAELLQRTGNRAEAARLLREALCRELAVGLGLAPDTDAATLAEVLAARLPAGQLDPATIALALTATPPATDADLLARARATSATRRAVQRPGDRGVGLPPRE